MNKLKIVVPLLIIILFAGCAGAVTGKVTRTITDYDEYIDENIYGYIPAEHAGDFIDDWYKTDAKPHLIANIEGSTEFEEKEVRSLYISLKNTGYVKAMQVTDNNPVSDPDLWAAKVEIGLEHEGTTAKSIIAMLDKVRENEPFEIESNTAYGGTLRSGNVLNPPLEFKIKIDDNAVPGVYPLKLNISYVFMQDVAALAKTGSDSNTTYNYYDDMHPAHISQLINITIKSHPEFEVTDANKDVQAGTTDVIKSTVKNTGNVVARDAVAYISVVSPFTSKIDEFYLGDMQPGEEKVAQFKVETDADALPQVYGVTTRVEYRDIDGKTKYSDAMKTPVKVTPAAGLSEKLGAYKVILYLIGLFAVALTGFKIIEHKK